MIISHGVGRMNASKNSSLQEWPDSCLRCVCNIDYFASFRNTKRGLQGNSNNLVTAAQAGSDNTRRDRSAARRYMCVAREEIISGPEIANHRKLSVSLSCPSLSD